MKSLLATGALLLAGFSMAFGMSFEIAFANPVQAGNTELRAGTYSIRQKGDHAIFTNLSNGDTYSVPATVQRLAEKNPTMKVLMSNDNQRIETIQLGGHAVDLQLGE